MQSRFSFTQNTMLNFLLKLFLFFFCFGLFSLSSQEIPPSFKELTENVIILQKKTYKDIDEHLNSYRKDSLSMRYFANECIKQKYLFGEAYAFNQLGRKYRNISEFAKAAELHRRALLASEEAKSLEFKVYSLNMLGVVYRRTDAIKTALDYNQEALELAETVENPSDGIKRSINVSLNSIGNIYQSLEQYDLAIQQFKKSLKLEKVLGNKLGLAINNQNIGECFEEQGKLEDALKSYRISLAYNKEINQDIGVVICNNSIAQVYIKQKKTQDAIKILEPTIKKARALGDQHVTTTVYINLGWAKMQAKAFKQAEANMLKGLDLAKKYNLPNSISKSNKFLSELYAEQGDYKTSFEYYKKAQEVNDRISNDRNLRYVNDMIIRYDSEKKNNQIEVLAKENEIVKLKLRKNQTSLLIGTIALALLAGIFYILYRQYQLKNEKQLLTLEQTMLRSQMNPHFLFNSLNSIKLYIINNEKKNAVHYLNKFSKLVRKILEASSHREISLAEELETVELYMNIENIRFSNEINFTTTISDNVDIHSSKIPSLILQPFLENALWHGLSSKDGSKNIDLHASKDSDNFLNITITDNGVGRAAAEKIKEAKVLKRKSVGIDITRERLANFSRDFQNSFNVEIVDLFEENGTASGTKIILRIPTI